MGGRPGGLEMLDGFDSVRLLLTNTLVERDTKTLVAGVASLRAEKPEMVDEVMAAVQGISDEARGLLGGQPVERVRLIERLEVSLQARSSQRAGTRLTMQTLIKENHAHLVTLQVSHPTLENIVAATSRPPYNLSTKLTGAGGGGCAVTLIPDEFDPSKLDELMDALRRDGFEPHLTTLGGKGAGVLRRQTSDGEALVVGRGEDEGVAMPLRAGLRQAGREAVGQWAEGLGEWVYT
jgi:mevalonate kinase